jgi:RNA polymerase sigma factor (sigma-70 family)
VRELVQKAQGGDLEAFGWLVDRFQDAVFGTAYALVGDFHSAQDLAQESFLQAWSKLGTLRDPDRFPGWLCRLTRNCCVDHLRRRGARPLPLEGNDPASSAPSAPERLERAEIRQSVLAAIRSLSEPNRLATTLFYIDGYSVDEVADFLDVPAGTVKRRLYDSRKRLKERMLAMVEGELKGARPGPELRDGVMREISRVEVRPEKSPKDWGMVLLVDKDGRCLRVVIGKAEESAIQRGVRATTPSRPMTHELFLSALESFGITVKEARVTDLQDLAFIGELVLERDGEERVLDSRPSDAVALAMMTGARVTVADSVMRTAGTGPIRDEAELETLLEKGIDVTFNRDLVDLCERLGRLSDDGLAAVIEEVGLAALATALSAMLDKIVTEEPSGEQVRRTVILSVVAHPCEGLPPDVTAAIESVMNRLAGRGIMVTKDDLRAPPTMANAREARRAVWTAIEAGGGSQREAPLEG